MSDYYQILGVEPDADEETLKTAWRKVAFDSHPDRHPDDPAAEARFKAAQTAYDVLSDVTTRVRYDTHVETPRFACSMCGGLQDRQGPCWPCVERQRMMGRARVDEVRFAAAQRMNYQREQAALEAAHGGESFWDRSGRPRGRTAAWYYGRKP